MTQGIKTDQIGAAINTAPGVTIEVLKKTPGGTRSTTSGSFVEIGSPTGELTQTFVVPVAGTYQIILVEAAYTTSAGAEARFRLSVDSGAQIIGPDDNTWSHWINTASVTSKTFTDAITLTAGTHTIRPEWRRASGSGTLIVDAGLPFYCRMTLVSGSGASGTLPGSAELGAASSPLGVSYADVTGLTVTVTTIANEQLDLRFSGRGLWGSLAGIWVQLTVDGGAVTPEIVASANAAWSEDLSFSRISAALSAGSHTIKVQAKTDTGSQVISAGARLDVMQYRGGFTTQAPRRVLISRLTTGSTGLLLTSGTAYFVYLGPADADITPQFVEFYLSAVGLGAQIAEIGFFSTPLGPNKSAQSLTKIVSTATVDDLLAGLGVKRNTAAFATVVPAGTHLWAGIRTAMATTQPTVTGLINDMAQGQILSTAGAAALTGAGPWAGAIITAALTENCPDLRGTLD